MRRPTFFVVAARFLRAISKIMPAHAVFVVLIAVLVLGSSVDAATVRQEKKKQNAVMQTFGLIGDGFKEFGSSIAEGYRGFAHDVASVMPWHREKVRVYATEPDVIKPAPTRKAPKVEVDVDIDEFLPEPLPTSQNKKQQEAVSPVIYTGRTSSDTFITNVTQGMGEDEVKTLVLQMLDSALGTDLEEEEEDDDIEDPAKFLNGLIARGVVDFSNATLKGFEAYQKKIAPLTIRDSTGNYKRHTVVNANEGGVSNNWSVGGDLEVKKKITVTGAATFQSGITAEKDSDFDGGITVDGNTTLGDDSTADSVTIKATTTVHADIIASANNRWDVGSHTEAFKDLFTSGSIYTQDLTILGTCTGCGGGGEWTDGGSVIYLTDTSDDVGIGTTTPAGRLGVDGSLFIAGNATLGDASGDTLTANASSSFENNAGILGSWFLGDAAGDTGIINASTTIQNNAGIFGSLFIGDAVADLLTVNASSTFQSPATFEGNVTLGSATDENIVINGTSTFRAGITFNGELTAGANNTYNLGSDSNAWKNIYASGTTSFGFDSTARLPQILVNGSGVGFVSGSPSYALAVGNGEGAYFGGNTIIGDASADTLTLNAATTFNAAIAAGTNNSYDIGADGTAFNDIFASGTINLGFDSSARLPQILANSNGVGFVSGSPSYALSVGNGEGAYFGGNTIIGDAAADTLTANASSTFNNAAGVLGNFFIGDSENDSLIINAALSSNLIAANNNGNDIGAFGEAFKDIYSSGTIYATNIGSANNSSTFVGQATFNNHVVIGNAAADSFYVAAGQATFDNGVTLGSSSADSILINGAIDTSLAVGQNNVNDLGANGTAWNDLFVSGTAYLGFDSSARVPQILVNSNGVGFVSGSPSYALSVGNGEEAYFGGTVILGDSTADTLTLNANITPGTTNDASIGSAAASIKDLYASGTVELGNPANTNIPILRIDTGTNGFVGISSTTLDETSEGAKLQVGGGIFANGDITIDSSNDENGYGFRFAGEGLVTAEAPSNAADASAFQFMMEGEADVGFMAKFSTSTSGGGQPVVADILAMGYDLNPEGELATTTFMSFVDDNVGSTGFHFNTWNAMTSSSTSVDRTLFTISNSSTRKFHVSAGGNVYAKESFVANSTDFGIGDLAEYVDLTPGTIVESGDAVQPDPDNPGKFRKVEEAYASNVGGIISNTAAFVMGARGENRGALALAGLVYTHVSDESGSIEVGDMLVTASEPGYLMKFDPAKAAGTNAVIVATALEPHDDGLGTIKTLVRAAANASSNSTLTIVETADGKLGSEQALDLDNQGIINVASIAGMNETWTVNAEGILTVKEVKAEQYTVIKTQDARFSSIGSGVIAQGDASATVSSVVVKDNSRIFITFRSNLNGRTYHVADIVAGQSFDVKLTYQAEEDLMFDYWIVQVDGEEDMAPNVSPVLTEDDVAAIRVEDDIQEAVEEFAQETVQEEETTQETTTEETTEEAATQESAEQETQEEETTPETTAEEVAVESTEQEVAEEVTEEVTEETTEPEVVEEAAPEVEVVELEPEPEPEATVEPEPVVVEEPVEEPTQESTEEVTQERQEEN